MENYFQACSCFVVEITNEITVAVKQKHLVIP